MNLFFLSRPDCKVFHKCTPVSQICQIIQTASAALKAEIENQIYHGGNHSVHHHIPIKELKHYNAAHHIRQRTHGFSHGDTGNIAMLHITETNDQNFTEKRHIAEQIQRTPEVFSVFEIKQDPVRQIDCYSCAYHQKNAADHKSNPSFTIMRRTVFKNFSSQIHGQQCRCKADQHIVDTGNRRIQPYRNRIRIPYSPYRQHICKNRRHRYIQACLIPPVPSIISFIVIIYKQHHQDNYSNKFYFKRQIHTKALSHIDILLHY